MQHLNSNQHEQSWSRAQALRGYHCMPSGRTEQPAACGHQLAAEPMRGWRTVGPGARHIEGVCVCVVKAFVAQKPGAHGGFGFGLSFALAHMCDRHRVGLRAHCVKVMDRLADGSVQNAKLDLGQTALATPARQPVRKLRNAECPRARVSQRHMVLVLGRTRTVHTIAVSWLEGGLTRARTCDEHVEADRQLDHQHAAQISDPTGSENTKSSVGDSPGMGLDTGSMTSSTARLNPVLPHCLTHTRG